MNTDDVYYCVLCGDPIYDYYFDHPLGPCCEECFDAYVKRELRHEADIIERI